MKKIQFILLLIVSALSFTSCASFSNKITRNKITKLTKENVQNIEGTYKVGCYESYFKARIGNGIFQHENSNGTRTTTINNFTNASDIDSRLFKQLIVDIELLSNKKIKFTYRYQDKTIKEVVLGIKLRKNGMIHLKNRKTKIMGVPLIFGNIQINKSRIGVSKSNDLVIHNLNHVTGGAFIILSDSRNHNTTYYFKRINASS